MAGFVGVSLNGVEWRDGCVGRRPRCAPRVSRSSKRTARATLEVAQAIDRKSFPILDQEVNGHQLIYLDSAATSQKPQAVIDALDSYYKMDNSNVHRGAHSLSARATQLYEGARDMVQKLINARYREEIIYTSNASEAINLVAYSWGVENLKAGDEILLTVMEHHSNLVPWQLVAKTTGATLKFVPLNKSGSGMDMDVFHELLNEKTKLVAVSHISNVLGCYNPVKEIVASARKYGAKVLIDACQSVPHCPVDVQDIGCDWLAASGHKMCAPTGIGFLYGKKELLEEMPPFLGGGEMIQDVFLEYSTYAELPHKFEAGTPPIAEAIGLGAAVKYLTSIGMDKILKYEQVLAEHLYRRLSEFKEITIYGPKSKRAALCAFNVDGVHPSDLSVMLDLEGVAVRTGHHCTQPLHNILGIDASARASLYFYNTTDEIDRFIECLKASVEILGGSLTRR
eukprot:CAMPEP_0198735314 /NCGR_PEP_ID=MMETSP1475-20131203/58571_1 /TAXON_ID= ORGANISM="Unidentified sp., Strain CCMP1999" /NCGR_SAMPLE_ID=MMETSP1475 /ASSEMBLY_ACC=CAM_ASM_001111 /LENGTH=453 /DNA_ID=CAMNT_0044498947 /DNA_START=134 /DNA_END=1495 /DNA_ORIENTATION=-